MNRAQYSIVALIVSDEKRAELFERIFREMLNDKTKASLKNKLEIERFRSVGEFLKAQRECKNLTGTIIDIGIEADEIGKRALAMLEELQIPTLRVSEKVVGGDAVDRKILLGKWSQLMEQVEAFEPRGLRTHARKLCYIKVRYHQIGITEKNENTKFLESKAITLDVSTGGCFIISTDDWSQIEHISIFVGDHPNPVPCRIAWRLPWGASHWKMPGIGVEFATTDESLKLYIQNFLKDS